MTMSLFFISSTSQTFVSVIPLPFLPLSAPQISVHLLYLPSMGQEQVDPVFIQAIEHRPNLTTIEAGGIPIIDLSPLTHTPISSDADSTPQALQGLVTEIEAACRDWGFFQVINHGVPPSLLDRLQSAAEEFFALPVEEKRRVRRDEVNHLGYFDTEHTKNVRDWKEVFDFGVQDPHQIPASADPECGKLQTLTNRWPEYPPNLREAGEEYAREVEKLAFKLLQLIALTLNLPARRLDGFFKHQTSLVRLNHYPPCPNPELALGVGHHKDSGGITILAQDEVGGLDVKRKSDGEWVRVKPIPGSYTINVGDNIQVWSNDKYESVEHRVSVNSERDRFSIPFFLRPAYYAMVAPLEELVDEANPARYSEYNWGKFFKTRRTSNFIKQGKENIQIYHFRKTELEI